jgi:dihydroflavonol-4-reductase
MNIFVTGGTGLLGSHLLYQLSCTEANIRALKRANSNLENVRKVFSYYTDEVEKHFSRIRWIEGNLLEEEFVISATIGVDVIYHAAAFVSYSARKKVRRAMFNMNVYSTQAIIIACKKNNIKKLCYVSSTSTLGSRGQNSYITEDSKLEISKYTTNYALTKLEAETLVFNAIKKGLNAVVLNPSIILGPGDWGRSSSKMILNISKGLRFYPKGIIGFVDVRDVVMIMISLIERDVFGEQFIISSENLSYKEVFTQIANQLQIETRLVSAPDLLLAIKWRIEFVKSLITGKEPLITKETVLFSKQNVFFSNEKIVKKLSYSFKTVSETIEYSTSKFNLEH